MSTRNRTRHTPARPAPTARRSRGALIAALLAVAAVAAGGAALALRDGGGGSPALPVADFPEPGVVHVHGLGIDPADGALYAATHSGLFRLPDGDGGKAERVANRYQDTMGFTVAGPRTFLGSGHPDLREDAPPQLGLIESTDAGQTWRAVSLSGQADLHGLQSAHDRVYAYNSGTGTFMVSADRTTWETRSQLPLGDFAVSPDDPDTILAVTQQGLARSATGGRTWPPIAGAPALGLLDWPVTGAAYGVTADGEVHVSADGGATWTARGSVGGEPEALLATDAGTVYVAVSGRGILASTDGGKTFTTRYAES